MLNAVIVTLRETLEASVLISLILVYCHLVGLNKKWLFISLPLAFLLAISLAYWLPDISELFEGVGQEMLFSSLLFIVACSLFFLNQLLLSKHYVYSTKQLNFNPVVLLMAISLITAVTLEGCEIVIYLVGASYQPHEFNAALTGSFFGAGIGLSIGVIVYYLIRYFKKSQFIVVYSLLSLISAGMLIQSTSYLMQAGWLNSGMAVWDSNFLLDESSLLGQLAYATLGYESTPVALQLAIYWLIIITSILSFLFSHFHLQKPKP